MPVSKISLIAIPLVEQALADGLVSKAEVIAARTALESQKPAAGPLPDDYKASLEIIDAFDRMASSALQTARGNLPLEERIEVRFGSMPAPDGRLEPKHLEDVLALARQSFFRTATAEAGAQAIALGYGTVQATEDYSLPVGVVAALQEATRLPMRDWQSSPLDQVRAELAKLESPPQPGEDRRLVPARLPYIAPSA